MKQFLITTIKYIKELIYDYSFFFNIYVYQKLKRDFYVEASKIVECVNNDNSFAKRLDHFNFQANKDGTLSTIQLLDVMHIDNEVLKQMVYNRVTSELIKDMENNDLLEYIRINIERVESEKNVTLVKIILEPVSLSALNNASADAKKNSRNLIVLGLLIFLWFLF